MIFLLEGVEERHAEVVALKRRAERIRSLLPALPGPATSSLAYPMPSSFLTLQGRQFVREEYMCIAQYLEYTAGDVEVALRAWYWSGLIHLWKPSTARKILNTVSWNTVSHRYIPAQVLALAAPGRGLWRPADVKYPHLVAAGQLLIHFIPQVRDNPGLQFQVWDLAYQAASADMSEKDADSWFILQIRHLLHPTEPSEETIQRWLQTAREELAQEYKWGYGHFNPDLIELATLKFFGDRVDLTAEQKNRIYLSAIPKEEAHRRASDWYKPSLDLPPGQFTKWQSIDDGVNAVWDTYAAISGTYSDEYDYFSNFVLELKRTKDIFMPDVKERYWRDTLISMPMIKDVVENLRFEVSVEKLLELEGEAAGLRCFAAYFQAWDFLIGTYGVRVFKLKEIEEALSNVLTEYDLWTYIQDVETFRRIYFNVHTPGDIPWVRPTLYNCKRIWREIREHCTSIGVKQAEPIARDPVTYDAMKKALEKQGVKVKKGLVSDVLVGVAIASAISAAAIFMTQIDLPGKKPELTPQQKQFIDTIDSETDRLLWTQDFLTLNAYLAQLLKQGKIYDPDERKFNVSPERLGFDRNFSERIIFLKNDYDYPVWFWIYAPFPFYVKQARIDKVEARTTKQVSIFRRRTVPSDYIDRAMDIIVYNSVKPVALTGVVTNLEPKQVEKSYLSQTARFLPLQFLRTHDMPSYVPPMFLEAFKYVVPKGETTFTCTIQNTTNDEMIVDVPQNGLHVRFKAYPWTLKPNEKRDIAAEIWRPAKLKEGQDYLFDMIVFRYDRKELSGYWVVEVK